MLPTMEEAEQGRRVQRGHAGTSPAAQARFLCEDLDMYGPPKLRCFETTDTCSSNHTGTTGQGQLCPCTPWNAGNAGLRVEDHLSLVISFLPSHMYTNPPGLEPLWKDVSRHLCDALFPVTLLTLPPVRTTVFVTAGRGLQGDNRSLCFSSLLDIVWTLIGKTEKRPRTRPRVWTRAPGLGPGGEKEGEAVLWFPGPRHLLESHGKADGRSGVLSTSRDPGSCRSFCTASQSPGKGCVLSGSSLCPGPQELRICCRDVS